MAFNGLYLVWTKGFARKTEVLRIAAAIGRPREWVAVRLMEFWEWAEDQTADGFIPALSVRNLSAMCPDSPDEFWAEFVRVGWLVERDGGIEISKFTRWMGKSSKRRLSEAERKRHSRNSPAPPPAKRPPSVRKTSASDADGKRPTRQDKTVSPPNPPPGGGGALPATLDTPAFRAAWEAWWRHRKEKRAALTPSTVERQLSKCVRIGAARAIAAIDHSIEKGWTGLFEPDEPPDNVVDGAGNDLFAPVPTVADAAAEYERRRKGDAK